MKTFMEEYDAMETLSLNAEQAMEALKVPPEQEKDLLAKLY